MQMVKKLYLQNFIYIKNLLFFMISIDADHISFEKVEHYPSQVDENIIFEMFELSRQISTIVTSGDNFEHNLSLILDKVLNLTNMDEGGIYLKDKKTGNYLLTKYNDICERFLQMHTKIEREWQVLLPMMTEGKVLVIPNTCGFIPEAQPDGQQAVILQDFRSFLGIPLISENSIEGFLIVASPEIHTFSETQIQLLSGIGQQLGAAIAQFNLIRKLQKSQHTYYELFDNAIDAIYTHDLEGNFLSVNQAGVDLLGYTKEEILRSNIRDFLTDDGLEIACVIKESLIHGDNPIPSPVLEIIPKDNKRKFLEFNIRPLIKNSEVVGVHGITRDVDKRFNATKNMLVFTKAINLASDGIDISDADHRITFINDAGANIFGYSRAELLGKHVDIFYAEEDLSNLVENVIPAIEKYGYWNGLILGRKKDGTAFPVEVTLSAVMDENGKPLVNIGVFREKKSNKSDTSS